MKLSITPIVTAVALFFLVSFVPVHADEFEGKGERSQEWKERMESKKQEIYKELNLSDVQKQQLEENRKKSHESMKALRQTMQENRELMRKELEKDTLDMGKINQIQAQTKEAHSKMMDNRLQGILEVRTILTPDQFKKFSARMDRHKEGFRHGKSEHHGDHRGGPQEHAFDGPREGKDRGWFQGK